MTLRRKIFIPLILALTIPVLLVGLYAYDFLMEDSRKGFLQNVIDVNTNTGDSIDLILNKANENLTHFASSRLFQNYVLLDESRYETHQANVYFQLLEYQAAHPNYFLIQLVLSSGQVDSYIDNRPEMQSAFTVDKWPFFQTFKNISPDTTEYFFEFDSSTQKFIISLATPMKFTEDEPEETINDNNTTYLSLSMYADSVVNLLSSRLNLLNVPVVIVTDDNQIIAHPKSKIFSTEELQKVNIGDITTSTNIVVNEQEYLVVPHELSAGLTLYSIMPNSIFSKTATNLFIQMGLFLVIFIMLISSISYFILNKILLAPISNMQLLVKDISDGKMNTVIPLIESKDELGFLSVALIDMREKISSSQQSIQQLAFIDSLTELPNRRSFQSELEHSISIASKAHEHFAVVFMDLDNFKNINDTLGHEAGDKLLLEVAKRIQTALDIPQYSLANTHRTTNDSTILARLGGDEFTILIPVEKTKEAVRVSLKKVIKTLSKDFMLYGNKANIGVSIGAAFYPSSADNSKELLKSADIAMYEAKNTGKNKVVFYSPTLKQPIVKARNIEISLSKAIQNNDLSLVFHPRMKLKDYSIQAFEIGVCWHEKQLEDLSITQLHAHIQNNSQLQFFTRWMLSSAVAKIQQWQKLGCKQYSLALNISSIQLEEAEFINDIQHALNDAGALGKYLLIEVSISPFFKNMQKIQRTLSEIRSLGLHITLNDFGEGLASFKQLGRLPISQIKLEQNFVDEAAQGNTELLTALIKFTKNIGVSCIVEGVCSSTQHDALLLSKCEFAQGTYYSEALTEHSVDDFIQALDEKQEIIDALRSSGLPN